MLLMPPNTELVRRSKIAIHIESLKCPIVLK
jgi:hypothetical protein